MLDLQPLLDDFDHCLGEGGQVSNVKELVAINLLEVRFIVADSRCDNLDTAPPIACYDVLDILRRRISAIGIVVRLAVRDDNEELRALRSLIQQVRNDLQSCTVTVTASGGELGKAILVTLTSLQEVRIDEQVDPTMHGHVVAVHSDRNMNTLCIVMQEHGGLHSGAHALSAHGAGLVNENSHGHVRQVLRQLGVAEVPAVGTPHIICYDISTVHPISADIAILQVFQFLLHQLRQTLGILFHILHHFSVELDVCGCYFNLAFDVDFMTLVRGAAVHDVNISDDLGLQILFHLGFGHVTCNGGDDGLQDICQHIVSLLLLLILILSIAVLTSHSSGNVALIGIITAGTAAALLALFLTSRLSILGSLLGYVGSLLVLGHLRAAAILCALSDLLEHLLNGICAGLGDTSAALLVLAVLTAAGVAAGRGLALLPTLTVLVGAGLLTLPLLALACLSILLLVTLIYCILDVRPHKEKHHIDLSIQLFRVIRVGGKINGL